MVCPVVVISIQNITFLKFNLNVLFNIRSMYPIKVVAYKAVVFYVLENIFHRVRIKR